MKRLGIVAVVLSIAAGSVFGEITDGWWMRHPAPVKDGKIQILIMGGLGYGFGGLVAVDYALPKTSFTLGGSGGFNYYEGDSWGVWWHNKHASWMQFPLTFRFAWHPDLGVDKLDVYAVAGVSIVPYLYTYPKSRTDSETTMETELKFYDNGRFSNINIGLGAKWFFSPGFGLVLETGYLNVNYLTFGIVLAL